MLAADEEDVEDGVTWAWEPDAAAVDPEDGAAWDAEDAEEEFCVVPLPAPLPPGTPGDWTRLLSCCPAGTGPEVWAGQLPAGFTGAFWPSGIVPGWPAVLPSANLLGFTPWN